MAAFYRRLARKEENNPAAAKAERAAEKDARLDRENYANMSSAEREAHNNL